MTSHVRNPVKKAQKSTENTVDKLHKLALQLPSPKDKNNNSCNVLKNGKYHNYGLHMQKNILLPTKKPIQCIYRVTELNLTETDSSQLKLVIITFSTRIF